MSVCIWFLLDLRGARLGFEERMLQDDVIHIYKYTLNE
jgi:hypothetical protein